MGFCLMNRTLRATKHYKTFRSVLLSSRWTLKKAQSSDKTKKYRIVLDRENPNRLLGLTEINAEDKMAFDDGLAHCLTQGGEVFKQIYDSKSELSLTLEQALMFLFYYRLGQVANFSDPDWKQIVELRTHVLALTKCKSFDEKCVSFPRPNV